MNTFKKIVHKKERIIYLKTAVTKHSSMTVNKPKSGYPRITRTGQNKIL